MSDRTDVPRSDVGTPHSEEGGLEGSADLRGGVDSNENPKVAKDPQKEPVKQNVKDFTEEFLRTSAGPDVMIDGRPPTKAENIALGAGSIDDD